MSFNLLKYLASSISSFSYSGVLESTLRTPHLVPDAHNTFRVSNALYSSFVEKENSPIVRLDLLMFDFNGIENERNRSYAKNGTQEHDTPGIGNRNRKYMYGNMRIMKTDRTRGAT